MCDNAPGNRTGGSSRTAAARLANCTAGERHAPRARRRHLLSIACRAGTEPVSTPRDSPIPDPGSPPPDPGSPPPLAGAAAARSLVAAPVVSSCGTAVVDGVLSPGEWDGTVSVRFGAVVPESAGGGEIPGTLQAMSDDVNLYVAVRLELPTPAFDQSHYLELDVDRSESINAR
jgi:hypothetical protein